MTGLTDTNQGSSTRPYLLRALHEWCTDNGFTPYIAVHVDHLVQVPMQYVKNNEIVLNVGFEATSGLKLGNEAVEFRARFGGVSRDIVVPVDHVVAIYARENGQGMAFPMPTPNAPGAQTVAPAPAVSARGLRLAAVDNDTTGGGTSALADVDVTPATAPTSDGGADPSPPGGPRPSLKRIK